MPMTVGVLREHRPGERRVALVPADVARVVAAAGAGTTVLVESDAGRAAWYDNAAYAAAGAEVVSADEVYAGADVLLCLHRPGGDRALRPRARRRVGGPPRHRNQPRRCPAHAQPGAGDGRADLAGHRRRIPGRGGGGERL